MAVAISSAGGLLALLNEQDDILKRHALQKLNTVVQDFWFQISGSLPSLEALSEDDEFPERNLASLLTSKVFYHLGAHEDALKFALAAGSLFDLEEQSEYVQTLIARCLDQYFELRQKQVELKEAAEIDDRLAAVVDRMLIRCCEHGQFEQAVGIALESRHLDKLDDIIQRCPDQLSILQYSLLVCQRHVVNREFRQQVLRLLIRRYESLPKPDWVEICQCLMFLDDAPEVAKILHKLLLGSEDDALLAYQVGFDLVENELQSFLLKVEEHVEKLIVPTWVRPSPTAEGAAAADTAMDTDEAPSSTGAAAGTTEDAALNPLKLRQKKLKDILSGKTPIELNLDFLYRNNHADIQILKNIKSSIDSRVSVTHSATILANAYMHAGTTVDLFLRDNLDWLSRATNWAKFSATAGLGVIHRGHLEQGQALMAPYLPRNGQSGSPYSEGGALYALGLIYVNHGHQVKQFLQESLRNAQNEIIQHGACLGLGLAALGMDDDELFEDLKNILFLDSAIAGEAASLSLGLLLAGSGSDKAEVMLAYAHDTQHEKIIRGLALGLALLMYGREEGAEQLIEQMARDQDPILRYGAMYVIGMAYRGTDNNAAVQKLLHYAVSDVNDDVRRAAVMCLGFVLMNVPEQCPKIVSLLAESFNPHVRYGAAMAVGLACAGTGNKDAVVLLEPMLSDAVDFVRQGALIAMALVLIQQPESKLASFRKRVDKFINDKHEEVMCKMGAIMAAGILDAGGRNVTIGLRSRSGYFRRTAVIGLAVFSHYWFWYPLSYFLALAFQPTALIGLNQDLKQPKFKVDSNCSPSLFAYLPPITQEAKEQTAKVPTAILSTTARAKKRAKAKEDLKQAAAGPLQSATGATGTAPTTTADAAASTTDAGAEDMETDEAAQKKESAAAPAKKDEPSSYAMDNPARVVPGQVKLVQFQPDSRYVPLRSNARVGIVMLKDLRPDETVELAYETPPAAATPAPAAAAAPAATPAAPAPAAAAPASQTAPDVEPPPPAPFEYRE